MGRGHTTPSQWLGVCELPLSEPFLIFGHRNAYLGAFSRSTDEQHTIDEKF